MQTSADSAASLLEKAASLLVYQSVLNTSIGQAFLDLVETIHQAQQDPIPDSIQSRRAYGHWFRLLAERHQSWQEYLLSSILRDDNPFTRQAQRLSLEELPLPLVAAACHDLQILQCVHQCDGHQLGQWLQTTLNLPELPVVWDGSEKPRSPDSLATSPLATSPLAASPLATSPLSTMDWATALEPLAAYYRQHGTGLFADYRALRWQMGHFVGIPYPDPVQVENLVGYEEQRNALLHNTESLLKGHSALHVLLYGSRGSGKSSLIKGLLHRYGDRGLRLIEVGKSELRDLPAIADQLRSLPQKFIIFVDDLSFEAEEDDYKALKVVLEGNLTARPQNVVVYATSNRRHLIREFFGDRPRPKDGDEVHAWDTVQEKLSFSDRFGLTLTFEPPDQNTYLQIVHHLAQHAAISLSAEDLEFRALQWATRHNGRSGRTARQFIDFLQADLSL